MGRAPLPGVLDRGPRRVVAASSPPGSSRNALRARPGRYARGRHGLPGGRAFRAPYPFLFLRCSSTFFRTSGTSDSGRGSKARNSMEKLARPELRERRVVA